MIASGDRLELVVAPRAHRRQALDRRRRRQDLALPRAPRSPPPGSTVPMMAGRALGHTGGTLDKLETIPGFRTALTPAAFRRVLAQAGFVLAGQSARLAPADRRSTRCATRPRPSNRSRSSPRRSSPRRSPRAPARWSWTSRSAAARSCRRSPSARDAGARADRASAVGWACEVRALLTAMDQPLGAAIGNASELREAIDVLRGGGPPDMRALTVRLGAEMLVLGRAARDLRDGTRRIEAAIASGAGLERFAPRRPPAGRRPARRRRSARACRAPGTAACSAPPRRRGGRPRRRRPLGRAATLLGAGPPAQGRSRSLPAPRSCCTPRSARASARGDALCTLHYDDAARAARPSRLARRAFQVGPRAPRPDAARAGDARVSAVALPARC